MIVESMVAFGGNPEANLALKELVGQSHAKSEWLESRSLCIEEHCETSFS